MVNLELLLSKSFFEEEIRCGLRLPESARNYGL